MKRENSDVPRFQYKFPILFHLKLKMFPLTFGQSSRHLQDTLLTKLLGQFIELHNTQFFKTLENFTSDCIVIFLSTQHFEKLSLTSPLKAFV